MPILTKHHLYVLKQLQGTSAKLWCMILAIRDSFWDKSNIYVQFITEQVGTKTECVYGRNRVRDCMILLQENMAVFILLGEKIILLPESYSSPSLQIPMPNHANFLITRITFLRAGIMHPIIASRSITQVQMMLKVWLGEAFLIPFLECD
jgi:hypothetical protein